MNEERQRDVIDINLKRGIELNLEMSEQLKAAFELLAYQDTDLPEDVKAELLESTVNSEAAHRYAPIVAELSENCPRWLLYGERIIRDRYDTKFRRLCEEQKSTVQGSWQSAYASSSSWIVWDMAKQLYYARNPDERSPGYFTPETLDSFTNGWPDDELMWDSTMEKIVNRHLGWEVETACRTNEDLRNWIKGLQRTGRLRFEEWDTLTDPSIDSEKSSSRKLEELGRVLSWNKDEGFATGKKKLAW